jgi:hypothetical protein
MGGKRKYRESSYFKPVALRSEGVQVKVRRQSGCLEGKLLPRRPSRKRNFEEL